MPTPALLLLIATLLPLLGFITLAAMGKRFGTPLAGYVGTAFIAASLACTMVATFSWIGGGRHHGIDWGFNRQPIELTAKWLPVGTGVQQDHPGFLDVSIYVDSLTVAMFFMVSGIATLVHVFSIGYMAEEERFPRFFTYLSLFCFAMFGLVLGGTLIQMFVFWELVGLCSYLLIGFYYERSSANRAAIKAFIVNRVGDVGLMIGLGLLVYQLGNVSLPHLWAILGDAGRGGAITLPGGGVFSAGLLTITGIALFFGAVGKSAQFPLHVWLPDAMEGPTPVSALIHAATMVAAGVYLVARIFPLLTPDAKLFIAIIGCITLTMAALIAMAQTDIKKVLAYSTLSQLGYMMLAMGVGSWVGGLFHLLTHACFKALLFLGSGSVIHAAHHEQELGHYGGLGRKIPITAITFFIAVLAISGFAIAGWGFSGFYSKDLILQHAAAFGFLAKNTRGSGGAYWLLFWCPAIVAYITPFYMMRCWTLTFWGKPRDLKLYARAHETPLMYIPLIVLAVGSIIGGKYMGVREMIEATRIETNNLVGRDVYRAAWPKVKEVANADEPNPPDAAPAVTHGDSLLAGDNVWGQLEAGEQKTHRVLAGGYTWLISIAAAFLIYMNGFAVSRVAMKVPPVRWVRSWLHHRMYFDEMYDAILVGVTFAFAHAAAAIDRYVLDAAIDGVASLTRFAAWAAGATDRWIVDGAVNGLGRATMAIGVGVREAQTGRVRWYVTLLSGVVAIAACAAVIARWM